MKKKYKILLAVILLSPALAYGTYEGSLWLYYIASFYYKVSQEKVLAEFPLGCKYDGYDLCNPVTSFKEFSNQDREEIIKNGISSFTKRLLFVKSHLDTCFGLSSFFDKVKVDIDDYVGKLEHGGYHVGILPIKFDKDEEKYDKGFRYKSYKATLDIKRLKENGLTLTFDYPEAYNYKNRDKEILIQKQYECNDLIAKGDDYLVYKCRYNNIKDKYISINWWEFRENGHELIIKSSNELYCLSEEYNYELYKSDEDFYAKLPEHNKECYEEYPIYITRRHKSR